MKKLLLIPLLFILYLVAKKLYIEDRCLYKFAYGSKMTLTRSYCINHEGRYIPLNYYMKQKGNVENL